MSLRRTRVAATIIAVTSPFALSACGTNFSAQTNQEYQAAVGANLRTGPLRLYNALFVANPDNTFTFSGSLLAKDGTTQKLTAVTAKTLSGDDADVKLAAPVEVGSKTAVALGKTAEIVGSGDGFVPGEYVTLTLTTDPGGDVQTDVPVVARSETYDGVATAPAAAK